MKRSSSREEGELQAPTRHRGPSIPSASRSTSAVAAARNNGIRMGSLSSYTLLKKVGGGAFGVVRMARHRHSGKVVAIKSPRTGGYHELLREASLLTACHGNPAIVKLREVACGFDPDDFHLVMEFVGPKDLHDVLIQRRRHGRLFTEEETCGLMRQLLAGVERMHALGVVHCDLKPGNVLVCKHDGRLKICDFGHAISMSEPAPPGAELQGTPTYMAPELLLGGNDRVPGIDMWSLGCVMAEIMTGKPIFHEVDNEVELAMQIIRFLGIPDDVSEFPLLVSTSSKLRDILGEERLSQPGFDVLSGLLEYNPKTRLTATAALLMPWFSPESNDPPSPGKDVN